MEAAQPSRADTTKRTILGIARRHFASLGYEGTSTRAIAKEAGINHSLIVYHFDNKEGLWRSVMEDLIESFGEYAALEDLARRSDDPVSVLRKSLHAFTQYAAANQELHRIMTIEGGVDSGRLHWLIETHLRSRFAFICSLIEQGQAAGRIRKGSPARLYYAAIGIAGTLAALSTEYEVLSGESTTSASSVAATTALIDALLFTED